MSESQTRYWITRGQLDEFVNLRDDAFRRNRVDRIKEVQLIGQVRSGDRIIILDSKFIRGKKHGNGPNIIRCV